MRLHQLHRPLRLRTAAAAVLPPGSQCGADRRHIEVIVVGQEEAERGLVRVVLDAQGDAGLGGDGGLWLDGRLPW
jgi:hypothetical protein